MTPDPIIRNLLLFGRVLRAAGLDVHHGRMLDTLHALELVGVRNRGDVRATLAALLVHRVDDLARFDAAFDLFFRDRAAAAFGRPPASPDEQSRAAATQRDAGSSIGVALEEPGPDAPADRLVGAYSAVEVLRTKDFGDFSESEFARARLLLERLPWQLGTRRTRRWARAGAGAVDLRPVVRRILTRGDVMRLPRRQRRRRPRPVVLIADVSGSMERYSRVLLHFVYGLAQSEDQVESFVFATRLTRLTPRLARRGGGLALAQIVRDVQDWGGGTRIGDALRTFNTRWGRRVMRNGPVVLIVSDGWDRGDPAVLSRELGRVRRSCRRLIWLNPLLGSASYEPLTRGMQAALRHVDDFLPAHNLASLEQLAERLRGLADRRRDHKRAHDGLRIRAAGSASRSTPG